MHFDAEALTLRFANRDELDRFHHELTDLLRRAVVAAAVPGEAAAVGVAHAQSEMLKYTAVTGALNALRGRLRDGA